MTHNSDGEETRPYTAGQQPTNASPPPYSPPSAPWTPPAAPAWQHQPTNHSQAPTSPHRSGPRRAIGVVAVITVIGIVAAGAWMYRSKFTGTDHPSETAATQSAEPSRAADEPAGASPTAASTASSASPTSAPAPSAPPVSSAELANFLPSAETLQALLITDPLTRTADAETTYTSVTTDRPDCGGAPNVALPGAYERSGYTSIRTQEFFTQPAPGGQDSVTQAVAAFPSEQQAKDFVSLEASRWANCKYVLVTISNDGEDAFVRRISSPTTKNGVLTVSTQSQVYQGLGCQRGLGARRNIVIDVQVCSPGGSAQAAELVSTIANRIPNN